MNHATKRDQAYLGKCQPEWLLSMKSADKRIRSIVIEVVHSISTINRSVFILSLKEVNAK